MDPNNNGNLELPLVGKDWRVTLPMEQWADLVQAATEIVEVLGATGEQGDAVERLDIMLRQALVVAFAEPPLT